MTESAAGGVAERLESQARHLPNGPWAEAGPWQSATGAPIVVDAEAAATR